MTITRTGLLLALLILGACSPQDQQSPQLLTVEAVSNQAHLLSGGDVLVEIRSDAVADVLALQLPEGASAAPLVQVDEQQGIRHYRSLVQNLPEGSSRIEVQAGAGRAEIALTNYPRTGPIFSGPHQQPYLCVGELAPDADGQPRPFRHW